MGMNRRKELPPEIFTDERLAVLPHDVRLTAIGMRANADNWGRESANPALVKAAIWALWPSMTAAKIAKHIEIISTGPAPYILVYEQGGRAVYQVVDWPQMSHRGDAPSRFPEPPSGMRPETFPAGEEEGAREREGEGPEGDLPELPPSRYCPAHRPNGTLKKCGPCATARERHERWQDAQLERGNRHFEEDT